MIRHALAFVVLWWASVLCAQPLTAESSVTSVTLYRGQALVTRAVRLPEKTGAMELIVSGLPGAVVPGSLFAEASAGLEVRAVTYRERAIAEAPREEVRALEREIRDGEAGLQQIARQQQSVAWKRTALDRLQNFSVGGGHADLQRGVLDPEALQKMMLFGFEQHSQLQKEDERLLKEKAALETELAFMRRKLSELQGAGGRTAREAVLFLERRADGARELRLSYLANNCGWSPTYVVRADGGKQKVHFDSNALIYQRTGEDWSGVELILSTATPSMSAAGPALAPFTVALVSAPQSEGRANKAQLQARLRDISRKQQMVQTQLDNATTLGGNIATAWEANQVANDMQAVEITNPTEMMKEAMTEVAPGEDVSLSYTLSSKVSLQSRDDRQMVRISRNAFAGEFSHVAIPVLGSQVHREALVRNSSDLDFLSGPMTVYLDGRFVGRAELPTVARGDSFVVGLGADSRLRARRRLVSRKERTQGGNRILEIDVELRNESFYEQPVEVRVMDRLPWTENENALKITVRKPSVALSEDARYLRLERPRGILRWDAEVPKGAAGEEAMVIEYGYTLEFDRNYSLQSPGGQQQQRIRAEFERFNRRRGAR